MKKKTKKEKVEIAVSFSFKLSPGNHLTPQEQRTLLEKLEGVGYESQDFFMSAKSSCAEKDIESKSEGLQAWCKKMVMKAVNARMAELHELAREEKVEVKKNGFAPNQRGRWEEQPTMDETGSLAHG